MTKMGAPRLANAHSQRGTRGVVRAALARVRRTRRAGRRSTPVHMGELRLSNGGCSSITSTRSRPGGDATTGAARRHARKVTLGRDTWGRVTMLPENWSGLRASPIGCRASRPRLWVFRAWCASTARLSGNVRARCTSNGPVSISRFRCSINSASYMAL